ncbi:MAG: ATP-binding cassette domain-containing protein [Streptosporangiales bacterium]|nr:ATP-binding cassette domain-containing protein [Streptosporangiales bacterium]
MTTPVHATVQEVHYVVLVPPSNRRCPTMRQAEAASARRVYHRRARMTLVRAFDMRYATRRSCAHASLGGGQVLRGVPPARVPQGPAERERGRVTEGLTPGRDPGEALRLDAVYKAFVPRGRKAEPLLALEDVTFAARPGEFISLVGPSGCGKSTVLNLLAGLMRPSAGHVIHAGREVHGVNTEIGYITQDDNLLPWRSMLRNVEYGLELRGVPRAQRRDRAREFIELVGLAGFEDHYPHELSGGMRKRAGIVRTLAYESGVVLMDEPFGPLDAQTRVILQDELLKLWDRRRPTVLFVTHDLVEAIALSDHILTFSGRPGRIKRAYQVNLPRPRDVFHIHEQAGFKELYDALWDDIRAEITGAGHAA